MSNITITIENENVTKIDLNELEYEIEKYGNINTNTIKIIPNNHKLNENDYKVYTIAKKELLEYFQSNRTTFSFPIKYTGSSFDCNVWNEIKKISYGNLDSYGNIAKKLNSKAYQAVGNSCGKNKLPIVIPCHRVIKSNGNIGNYEYGEKLKIYLINLENYKSI